MDELDEVQALSLLSELEARIANLRQRLSEAVTTRDLRILGKQGQVRALLGVSPPPSLPPGWEQLPLPRLPGMKPYVLAKHGSVQLSMNDSAIDNDYWVRTTFCVTGFGIPDFSLHGKGQGYSSLDLQVGSDDAMFHGARVFMASNAGAPYIGVVVQELDEANPGNDHAGLFLRTRSSRRASLSVTVPGEAAMELRGPYRKDISIRGDTPAESVQDRLGGETDHD